ncbi:hypothetical protein OCH239_07300 [Roseivivax halodurans JCM 10272]|uniref:Lipoprotein n=1 Tax=Roseivivax halodurans JCM 10272 TaxID=1449350 RepID=X7ELD1_9RHOB|nr:hypothetical protein [Roseivivax halodurans]ETX15971.1 hypothetical protein OCH239_07300 [Roseivivax halodurans JCM 10272]
MSSLRALVALCLAALVLAGCATPKSGPDATPEAVARAAYRHDGPPAITLLTMVSNRDGGGAHSSMMINASQRVVFDPAGSVSHSRMVERGDVIYGITPELEELYEGAHARETYHVVIQRREVPPEVAEKALRLVMENGTVSQAFCTQANSRILRQLPGFETIRPTFYPSALSKQFGALPGVTTRTRYETDGDDKSRAVDAYFEESSEGASG